MGPYVRCINAARDEAHWEYSFGVSLIPQLASPFLGKGRVYRLGRGTGAGWVIFWVGRISRLEFRRKVLLVLTNDKEVIPTKGGVGLIITGHSYVRTDGQAGPNQLGAYSDSLIPGLKEMTEAVHAAGGRIIMQLAHAGRFASEKLTGQTALAQCLYQVNFSFCISMF